jgi:hypothetical protein
MACAPVGAPAVVSALLVPPPLGEPPCAEHIVRRPSAVGGEHLLISDEPSPAMSPGGIGGAEPEHAVLLSPVVHPVEIGVATFQLLHHLTGGNIVYSLFSAQLRIHPLPLLSQTILS